MNVLVCVVVFILCLNYRVLALSGGKALLCQDPEDGSLHPVNTSWQSTLFCGNYTCKIKKKNTVHSEKDELKLQDGSTTSEEVLTTCHETKHKCHNHKMGFENTAPMHTILLKIQNNHNHQNEKSLRHASNDKRYNKNDQDSYSSGSDFISQILESVNDNEHDAIEEAYNLSKDYDGKATSGNNKKIDIKKTPTISYFYEPLLEKVNDVKDTADISLLTAKDGHNTAPKPLIYRANELIKNTTLPCDLKHHITPKLVKMPFSVESKSSLRRRLNLPFPILNAIQAQTDEQDLALNRQYQIPDNIFRLNHVKEAALRRSSSDTAHSKKQSENLSPVDISNTMYLPGRLVASDLTINSHPYAKLIRFPSKHPTVIEHTNQAWFRANHSVPKPTQESQMQALPKHRSPYSCSKSYLIKKLMLRKFDNKMRIPWQTNDLNLLTLGPKSSEIDTRPVKTKMQRIGKVIKMDNILRPKRQTQEMATTGTSDEYEFYLEKVFCPVQVELGYYKVGNSSQPFPQCCPQKIEKLKTHFQSTDPDLAYFKV